MPIYDYDCQACGPFTAVRSIAKFQDPCACPDCGVAASRSLSAPSIASMDPTRRSALGASERDASSRGPAKAAHPAGCGCCTRQSPIPGAIAAKGGRVFSSNGPLHAGGR